MTSMHPPKFTTLNRKIKTSLLLLSKKSTCKRKDPPTLFENDNGQMSIEVLCKDETPISLLVDEVVDGIEATSSTEGDTNQDYHWKRKKKKLGFEDASTNMFNGIFNEDGATSPSFIELSSPPSHPASLINEANVTIAHLKPFKASLGFEGASTNIFNGNFNEDGATSLSFLKLSSPLSHPASLINEAKVIMAHIKSSKASVPPSCLSPLATSNFEPQETIMTRECHQKSLFDVQHRLIDVKEESAKANGCMEELQATFAKIDKELKTLSAKRKKTMAYRVEQREKLSKG
ncbi:hypothetical protein HAX54_037872 [Datura stramonium]|uniref:Uncharacterized protein n=1 Tax=Datura stramonium TaxID=4076 RepID=A0ABS8VLU0_DATST|nr:hypothetical protein [Datura stramonium]